MSTTAAVNGQDGNGKRWLVAAPDLGGAEALARQCGLPLTVAALLCRRGLADRDAVQSFFSATLADLPSPFLLMGMEAAVAAVARAFREEREVVVYGDYDADGTTAAALLFLFLRACGFAGVHVCQPLRLTEGYGLRRAALERQLPGRVLAGRPLLITVDCGISDRQEVALLKEQGWSVIVTDHHLPPSELPRAADAVLDPLQAGCPFPDKGLAGVGVAFYLAMGIRSHFRENGLFPGGGEGPNLKELLDIVALGTVADMVPLLGVNRILVRAGIEVLGQSRRPGIKELVRAASLRGPGVSSGDIAFRLAPRLNAAGRMGDAGRALELLVTGDRQRAAQLALAISEENEKRKNLVAVMVEGAGQMAEEALRAGRLGLVIAGREWHPGVVGIGAARMVEKYCRPTLLFAIQEDGTAKGSGRSLPGLDIHNVLAGMQEMFLAFGGHGGAVGLSLAADRMPELEQRFEAALAERLRPEMLLPRLVCDWQEREGAVFADDFLAWYQRLAPFGQGNPEPLFMVRGEVREPRLVGAGHLKFRLRVNGASHEAIGFGLGDLLARTAGSACCDVVFRWRRNTFQEKERWQVEAQDLRIPTD